MEYNNDFERRRAYISSREKLRKRRQTVHITILLIVLGVLLLGIGGLLLFKKGGHLSTQLKNNTSESSAESDPSGDDKTTVSLAESGSGEDASPESQEAAAPAAAYNTGDTALDGILNSAHAKFVTYDYDAAIEILNSNPDYAENSDVKEIRCGLHPYLSGQPQSYPSVRPADQLPDRLPDPLQTGTGS